MYKEWLRQHFLNRFQGKSKKRLAGTFLITFCFTFIVLLFGILLIAALNPEYYSLVTLNKKKRYLVEKGDFLVGKAIPDSKIKIRFVSKKQKYDFETTVLKNGSWSYKLPNSISSGGYVARVANYDSKNVKAFSKLYSFRVASSKEYVSYKAKVSRSMPFKIGDVMAQEPDVLEETESAETPYEVEDFNQEEAAEPEVLSIKITDAGLTNYAYLVPGGSIKPDVVVYSNLRTYLTDDESLSLKWYLADKNGDQKQELITEEDCYGIRSCGVRMPENAGVGNYRLVVELHSQGSESSNVIASDSIDVIVGDVDQNEAIVPTNETDTSVAPDIFCLGDVCPTQSNATLVNLSDLYITDTNFNSLDGSAQNIISDCGENCARPLIKINQTSLQTGFGIDALGDQASEELKSCLRDTQDNPSSSLSLVAGVAMLESGFLGGDLGINQTETLKDFVNSGSFNCSLDSLSDQLVEDFNAVSQSFQSVKKIKSTSFEALENYFQTNKYPVLVETKFNQNSLHTGVVLAITDKYVWMVDPLDPKNPNYVLRITKETFKDTFFNGTFWEILPQISMESNFRASYKKQGVPAIGSAFLRKANGQQVPAFAINENDEIVGKTNINSSQDKFNILGKYKDDNFMYEITFQNTEGLFAIPIRETIIEQGNLLDQMPLQSERDSFVGVRINEPFFYDHDSQDYRNQLYTEEFEDLNKLGVGNVRIVIEDAEEGYLNKVKPLIERAFQNDYFVILQYKPGSRIPKGVETVRLGSFIQYIQSLGVSPDKYAVELYNEPNLRHYWNDCRNQSLESDEDISRENPRAVGWSTDDNGKKVYIRDCMNEEDYAESLAIAIRQASEIIWKKDPKIKLIIGALSLQGSTPPAGVTIQEEHQRLLDTYLGEVQKYNDLSKFDYSIHGYQIWDSGPLTHNDGSDKGADGLLHVYNAYKNNSLIRNVKGDRCNCFWITEFSVDQLNYDAYNLIAILEHIKNTRIEDGLIHSVFIHEFNGITEPGNPELWQLWDNGKKLPAYNLVQYYLFRKFIGGNNEQ